MTKSERKHCVVYFMTRLNLACSCFRDKLQIPFGFVQSHCMVWALNRFCISQNSGLQPTYLRLLLTKFFTFTFPLLPTNSKFFEAQFWHFDNHKAYIFVSLNSCSPLDITVIITVFQMNFMLPLGRYKCMLYLFWSSLKCFKRPLTSAFLHFVDHCVIEFAKSSKQFSSIPHIGMIMLLEIFTIFVML